MISILFTCHLLICLYLLFKLLGEIDEEKGATHGNCFDLNTRCQSMVSVLIKFLVL